MQGKRTANRRAAALRQALMLSISSMLVCAMMLVGMTYAWFTDSAVAAVNSIHTGTVNADLMYYKESDNDYHRLSQNTSLFDQTTWIPGHVEIKYLKIENNGTLPIRYSLGLNASMQDTSVQDTNLLSKLQFAFIQLTDGTERIALSDDRRTYTLDPASNSSGGQSSKPITINYASLSDTYKYSAANELGTLTASGTDGSEDAYYAFIIYYPSTATNNTTDIQVAIGLRLLAIQQKNTDSAAVNESNGPWADAADTDKTSNSMPEDESASTTTSDN